MKKLQDVVKPSLTRHLEKHLVANGYRRFSYENQPGVTRRWYKHQSDKIPISGPLSHANLHDILKMHDKNVKKIMPAPGWRDHSFIGKSPNGEHFDVNHNGSTITTSVYKKNRAGWEGRHGIDDPTT